jgi:histidinol dehydrogenase
VSIRIHCWSDATAAERQRLLQRPPALRDHALQNGVLEILAMVRERGDAALTALTARFDGVTLERFSVSEQEFDEAERGMTAASLAAIDVAIGNVRRFHEAQVPVAYEVETMPGVRCERVSRPIDCVGLYVPAGSAPLPSTAIMLSIPAGIAGCPRRVMCTPPRPDGRADSAVLIAVRRGGVTEIYKLGGAQAIAAMAFGTESVPKVDKIFGPGNAWVTAAKTMLASATDATAIDMAAGPSEVLVIADSSANPEFVAADLLSQAEHGGDSQVVLVATDSKLADAVAAQIPIQLPRLKRASVAREAMRQSRFILADGIAQAAEISNTYAPEHLILQVLDPRSILPAIRNAGSVFLGPWSPESAGDYCSGTNHVLPTSGHARSSSGLAVEQFMRQMTVQELTRSGLESIADSITELALLEGLDAHAAAVSYRLQAGVPGRPN